MQEGNYVIFYDWRFCVAKITKVTPAQVRFISPHGDRERRLDKGKVLKVSASKEEAEKTAEKLTSALAHKQDRIRQAQHWFDKRKAEILAE